jgi:LacI family transcriptional regulator
VGAKITRQRRSPPARPPSPPAARDTRGRRPSRPRGRRVALLVETSNAYARGILHGIIAYTREHETWSVHLGEQGRGDDPPAWLAGWRGDGILARIENGRIAAAVTATGLPVVDVSAARTVGSLPWVETNDRAIADLAARHLLDRGLRHLAFCGDGRFNWSRWRCDHFVAAAAAAGADCAVYETPAGAAPGDWEAEEADVARWLRALPKPLGVMASYDQRGRQVLGACRRAGLAVPDAVAVIGVDDDELLCTLADPPLSSVRPDARRAGYEAAALLERLMSGRERPRGQAVLIDPLGVATRRSTDVLALDDPDVSAALRFVRDHACAGIGVSDVLAAVPLSRRVLESRFRKLLGRTPHEEIARVQFDRVKQLLRETRLPLDEVARRAGFRTPEYLSTAFRRAFGMPPSQYRKEGGLTFATPTGG